MEENDAVRKILSIKEDSEISDDIKSSIGKGLPLLEHFAVGVNTKIYDIEILNRMAGNKMLQVNKILQPILEQKRHGCNNKNNYKEWSEMINNLQNVRTKK